MKAVAGDPRESKATLREEFRRRLRDLSAGERDVSSERIRRCCMALPEWGRARVLALYHPRPDEPDLWPLASIAWAEGRQVVLPSHDPVRGAYRWRRVMGPGDLVSGKFGIPEPSSHCGEVLTPLLDLAFVPGLGFSEDGVRLGRGQGFYDRLLESFRGGSFGVAFDCQILPRIPREDHDFRLDGVITPSGCRFAPTGAE